jgi:hypothetical protein
MRELRKLQTNFQHYLLNGDDGLKQSIVNTKPVSIETRLGIYKDSYQIRLVESLASNYPCLQRLLGEEAFQRLGLAYVVTNPSHFRSIRWFGDQLPNYLQQNPDSNYPYLSEMAEFEWNMTLSFDASDTATVTIEEMATLPAEAWAELVLVLHPSVQRMNFFWNVVPMWQCLVEEKPIGNPVKLEESTPWILWRKDYLNRFNSLSDEEAWALDSAIKGSTFSDICEGLCQWNEEEAVGMRAASFLKSWIQSGLIARIDYPR